jgi:hypothetical protein
MANKINELNEIKACDITMEIKACSLVLSQKRT